MHPLKIWREREGKRLEDVASEAGASPASISRIENRKQYPSLELVARLKSLSRNELSADDFLPKADQ